MAQNKLINQGQFRNLGTHLELSYVDRDTANLNDAIHILQDKLDYINYKYRPAAIKSAQEKLGETDQSMNDLMAHLGLLSKHRADQVRAIIYGKEDDDTKDNNHDKDDHHEPNKSSESHDAHDASSHNDASHHDHQNGNNNGHHDNHSNHGQKESDQDLDFLNNLNHK